MSGPARVFEDPLVSGDWCVEMEHRDGAVELAIFSVREIVRYVQPDAVTTGNGPSRIGDEHRQPVERMRNAGQHCSCPIGKQAQRRRGGRQSGHRPYGRLANAAQTSRVGHPE